MHSKNPPSFLNRRQAAAYGLAGAATVLMPRAWGAEKIVLRISSPAVASDWHAKMWTVFKEQLDKTAPGEFDVQISLNAALFKQGAEPVAMARGNLEMATVSAADIAKVVPEFSIFTAGYVVRSVAQQQAIFAGAIGSELFKKVAGAMDITPLATAYLGTRQISLREVRSVKTPADLKGVKLRMPSAKDWLFLGNALGATAMPMGFSEVYMALKNGTIDGHDNPLPSIRAAKFYEVTKQIVLTQHLVDGLFIAIANKTFAALSAVQKQKVQAAAQAAVAFNNQNRIQEESSLIDFFKKQGLQVDTPDVAAFRKAVQLAYQNSDYAKSWPQGLLERIQAVPS